MATKKEAKARKAAWALGLAEGRIVKTLNDQTFTLYPTVERAIAALAVAKAAGIEDAEIVQVSV